MRATINGTDASNLRLFNVRVILSKKTKPVDRKILARNKTWAEMKAIIEFPGARAIYVQAR